MPDISPSNNIAGLSTSMSALQAAADWTKAAAARLNMSNTRVLNGLTTRIPGVGTVMSLSHSNIPWPILAIIQSTGPAGTEPNYTDNRYWWKAACLLQNDNSTGAINSIANPVAVNSLYFPTQTFTNLAEGTTSHMLATGSPAWVYQLRGANGTAGTFTYNQWVAIISPGVRIGRITGNSGSFSAWTYSVTFVDGMTANAYNGFEWNGTTPGMIAGSPGSLGITVGATGQVNSGTCVVQAIGNGGYMPFYSVNGRWTFSAPNSAQ